MSCLCLYQGVRAEIGAMGPLLSHHLKTVGGRSAYSRVNVRVLLQPPRVHRFLDCFRGWIARVDSRSARLRSFLESPLWSHPSRPALPTRKFLTPSSSAAAPRA